MDESVSDRVFDYWEPQRSNSIRTDDLRVGMRILLHRRNNPTPEPLRVVAEPANGEVKVMRIGGKEATMQLANMGLEPYPPANSRIVRGEQQDMWNHANYTTLALRIAN